MKVNTAKTHLIVIYNAQSFTPEAMILGEDWTVVTPGSSMKILGFHMKQRPSMGAHVKALRKRFRQRYWLLYHLKRFGFSEEELCKVYRTIIRLVADYCCVVYHSMLSEEQDEQLDRCLYVAGSQVYFWKRCSINGDAQKSWVTMLWQLRTELCDKIYPGVP